jgi:hypothetical protein
MVTFHRGADPQVRGRPPVWNQQYVSSGGSVQSYGRRFRRGDRDRNSRRVNIWKLHAGNLRTHGHESFRIRQAACGPYKRASSECRDNQTEVGKVFAAVGQNYSITRSTSRLRSHPRRCSTPFGLSGTCYPKRLRQYACWTLMAI